MRKATVIYTGTLVIEGDKIFLKDIAVISNFNNSLGKLFWDKKLKQWFIYNEKEDLYNDIKPGLIVSYNWNIVISSISELEVADEKSEPKEIAGILKWLN